MEYVIQVRHSADRDDLEAAVDRLLWLTGCSGSASEEIGGEISVSLYYPDRENRDAALEKANSIVGIDAVPIDRDDTDWLAHYQQSLVPILIGARLVVAPDAVLIQSSDRLSIIVPQERAFGTGSHETTSLCLETLEEIDLTGRTVLDIGTGSGILAIAAAKLGALRVIAFDNDLEGWGVVERNVVRNGLMRGRVLQFFGTIDALAGCKVDVVTMNIIPEIILPMLDGVVAIMEPGGSVVLSGILTERRFDVLAATEALGLELVTERIKGEWWSCALTQ